MYCRKSFLLFCVGMLLRRICLNIPHGEILFNKIEICNVFIPEILTIANNGYTVSEITCKTTSVILKQPVEVQPFSPTVFENNFMSNTLSKKGHLRSITGHDHDTNFVE